MNVRVVVRVNAVVSLTLGAALAIPLALSWLYGDGSWASFLFPGASMIVAGAVGIMAPQASSRGCYKLAQEWLANAENREPTEN